MWIILIVAFFIGIFIAALTMPSACEGFSIKEQVLDFTSSETPKTKLVLDEYGNRVNTGYYFVPYGTDKWSNGIYKKYTVKPVPYGQKATDDLLSTVVTTDVAAYSSAAATSLTYPDWRELSYAEYSKLEAIPLPSAGLRPGYFKIRQPTTPLTYKMAKIPANHALLDPSINPNDEFLKWTGSVEGEALSEMPATSIPDGYYQLKLIRKFTNNDPNKPEYVYSKARIPQGYIVDPGLQNKMGLIASASKELPFEWRELTFQEYSGLVGKQGQPVPASGLPSGYFIVKSAGQPDRMVPLPLNHALLTPAEKNPDKQFLMWNGPAENIVGQGDKASAPVGDGYYRLKLVTEYAGNNPNGAPTFVYKRRKIPVGYKLDTSVANELGLVRNVGAGTYDANAGLSPNDAAYHGDPTKDADSQMGTYYNFDSTGKLVQIEHSESNFAPVLYYVPGAYRFGTSNYVPNYEDSVYLSRVTRNALAQTAEALDKNPFGKVVNTADTLGGFCNANKHSVQKIEEKCLALDKDACASTSCCVLLGGQKCVAGSKRGPTLTANYSDYELANKDFYYYQGKCYGNC